MGKVRDTLIIGSMFITIPFLWWAWTSDTTNPPAPEVSHEDQMRSGARLACRTFIADRLHDPNSAEWGMRSANWYATWPASLSEDTVTVQPTFRAANSFGATILSRWTCEVRRSEDRWLLVSLHEL